MLPCASISTSPYALGLSTGVSTMVALALRSRCRAMTAGEIDFRQHVAVEDDHGIAQVRRRRS